MPPLKVLLPLFYVASLRLLSSSACASILPPNQLYLEDNKLHKTVGLSTKAVKHIFDDIKNLYAPLAEKFGATFDIQLNAESSEVNALASRQDGKWVIFIYGGFLRRPELTNDALTVALCHEAGHLFGGYPFATGKEHLSSEGQADYFATQVCARALWSNDQSKNALAVKKLTSVEKEKCNEAWENAGKEALNLCYRMTQAAKPLAVLLARISSEEEPEPSFETPDTSVVKQTLYDGYPKTQCRLDTFLAGALCERTQAFEVIPGFKVDAGISSLNSVEAEKESREQSCYEGMGMRGKCWFRGMETVNR